MKARLAWFAIVLFMVWLEARYCEPMWKEDWSDRADRERAERSTKRCQITLPTGEVQNWPKMDGPYTVMPGYETDTSCADTEHYVLGLWHRDHDGKP